MANSNKITQFTLIGVVALLVIVLSYLGFNSDKAIYDKPIEERTVSTSKADIHALLIRFAGSNKKINALLEELNKDTLNSDNIEALELAGTNSNTDIFSAYAFYLKGVVSNADSTLQKSADLFFEAATHDPDSLADKTTYSVYGKRACNLILEKSPKNLRAMTRKATFEVYLDGAVMAGVTLLKEVESIDSNYAEAQHHLMLLSLQSGQYEKAKKRLKKLLSLQPDNRQYADILSKLETH